MTWLNPPYNKNVATNIGKEFFKLLNKIEIHSESNAFIIVKDHKQGFPNQVKCRLINPASNQLGRISKRILDKINNTCREKLDISQWKNTDDTINWFNATHNQNPTKEKATFL